MTNIMISLRDVGVRYTLERRLLNRETFQALKALTFDIYAGESLGIVGLNGAGKSTLLRVISSILKPARVASFANVRDPSDSAGGSRARYMNRRGCVLRIPIWTIRRPSA